MLLNILSRIFLAHIIADFPLQFDWIFRMKKKGFLGGVPHASLHVLMIFLFLPDFWQYLLFYVYLLVILILHALQDNTKIWLWKNGRPDNLWLFLSDQFFHIMVMFVIFLFSFTHYFNPSNPLLLSSSRLNFFLSFLFFVGFGSTVLIFYLERTFLGISNENLSEFEKRYGVLERLLIFGLVSVDLRFLALAPAFYLVRRMLNRQRVPAGAYSVMIAASLGVLFYFFY